MIFAVPPSAVDEYWPHAIPWLERFSKETLRVNTDEIYESVKNSEKQLWMIECEGSVILVVITEIWKAEAGSICTIRIASGSAGHDRLREICEEIERWAVASGCVGIEICGRKGWAKVLDGFKETGVILEKDLRQVH